MTGHPRSEVGEDVEPRARFLLELGLALHRNGVSAFRLEGALTKVAETLGLRTSFFSTPTALMASVDGRTHLLRAEPGDVDLDRMCALDEIGNAVIAGELSPEEGTASIARVLAGPPPFSPLVTVAAYVAASSGAALFLAGSLVDCAVGAVAGLFIGGLALVAGRSADFARVFLIVTSLFAAGLAWAAAAVGLPVDLQVVTIAGLIAFVPGLSLTVAMNELATGHLASGTARLAYVAIVLVQMGLGVALAERLSTALSVAAPDAAPSLLLESRWLIFALLPVSVLAFAVLLRARLRDYGWLLLAGGATLGVAVAVSEAGDPVSGSVLGALTAGVVSNGLARWMNRPAANFLVPSLFLLVPGSVGLKSVDSLLAHDVLGGVQTAFQMSLIAVGLVGGMLVANVVLPARRHL
ncbi:MAG: threonine/serine exporter family protein [Deltaproteobacteria bacterium]|nr:MAG: threonine/serine exporter family protein [Deltaproteobacteria bacterium]